MRPLKQYSQVVVITDFVKPKTSPTHIRFLQKNDRFKRNFQSISLYPTYDEMKSFHYFTLPGREVEEREDITQLRLFTTLVRNFRQPNGRLEMKYLAHCNRPINDKHSLRDQVSIGFENVFKNIMFGFERDFPDRIIEHARQTFKLELGEYTPELFKKNTVFLYQPMDERGRKCIAVLNIFQDPRIVEEGEEPEPIRNTQWATKKELLNRDLHGYYKLDNWSFTILKGAASISFEPLA